MNNVEAVVLWQFIAAGACVVIAACVLVLGRHPVHIALAGLLTMRGLENALEAWNAINRSSWSWYAERGAETLMFWSFALFATTFLSAFYLQWPARKGWRIAGPILVVGVAFAAMVSAGWLGEHNVSLTRWQVNWGALPVALQESIRLASALLISWVGWKSDRLSLRRVASYLSFGTILFSAYWAGRSLVWGQYCMVRRGLDVDCGFYADSAGLAIYWIRFLAVLGTFAAWWVVAGRFGAPGRSARAWVMSLGTLGLIGGYARYRDWGPMAEVEHWYTVVGVLAQVVILAYGIARFQILGMRRTVRWTITQSGIVVVLGGAFLVVSQVAGALLEDTYNSSVLGAVATMALLLAFQPIHALTGRLASRMVPPEKGSKSMSPRQLIYYEQAEFAWADGVLSRSERVRLDRLRVRLGLSAELAVDLEAKASL